jgi:hypothetical protein
VTSCSGGMRSIQLSYGRGVAESSFVEPNASQDVGGNPRPQRAGGGIASVQPVSAPFSKDSICIYLVPTMSSSGLDWALDFRCFRRP